MRKEDKYKIIIGILALAVVLEAVFVFVTRPKKAPPVKAAFKGKIAIVIDDWGYNLNNIYLVKQIKYPLTVSVLPALSYSKAAAEELHGLGFEVILHLPMEPREKYRLEKNTILNSMAEPAITEIIKKDLADIPYVVGVSNHMGSAATENLKMMTAVFKELKKGRLYFLDSLVSGKTVCSGLAKKMHLAFAKRDIFLDNQEEDAYIRKQIYKLKMKARINGEAIGIGHDRKITLQVLQELMPELENEGYKFVFVSELVK